MIRTIIAVLGFGIAGSVFMLYTKPAYDRVQGIKTEIARYDEALERANELQKLKQTLLSRFNAFDPNDIESLKKLLPDHVDNVRLVLDFDNLASKHGLAIQNVVIGRSDTNGGTVGAGISKTEVIGGSSAKYDSLTLRFTTQGSYDAFVKFMEDIQGSLRIVDLVSLTLSRAGEDKDQAVFYRFDVSIRTYWLK